MRSDRSARERSADWDPAAFARFYRRYEREVAAVLMRRTGRADLAADLTSEVFAAALLPEVEWELVRAARQPGRSLGVGRRPRARATSAIAATVAAVAVAVAFLLVLRHHHGRPGVVTATGRPPATFPGAPRTQPGSWEDGSTVCPLAAPNRYLPPRSGCVSVLHVDVDVDGDRHPGLVLLYAHLGHHSVAGRFAPTAFTLEVVRAGGGVVRVRLDTPASNAALVESGNVNGVPGAELFIQVSRISSGSSAVIYTFHAGRLVRVPVMPAWGGDSAVKAGFACRRGRPLTLIQRTFDLSPNARYDGRWRQTETVYAWRGGVLQRIARRTSGRRGPPPAAETGLGEGCGPVDRATTP